MSWTVKMCHFGKDALTSYSGQKFDMSWEDTLNVFHHIYSKEYGNKMKVRRGSRIPKQATGRVVHGQVRR
jgi:hypothetical protein